MAIFGFGEIKFGGGHIRQICLATFFGDFVATLNLGWSIGILAWNQLQVSMPWSVSAVLANYCTVVANEKG